jgi:hypothetical protein
MGGDESIFLGFQFAFEAFEAANMKVKDNQKIEAGKRDHEKPAPDEEPDDEEAEDKEPEDEEPEEKEQIKTRKQSNRSRKSWMSTDLKKETDSVMSAQGTKQREDLQS